MPKECIRTTITIPIELLEKINQALRQKVAPSRNALLIHALQQYLENWEQEKIDEQIAQMATDAAYQTLNLQMVEEYEAAGWEALRLSEENL